MSTAQPDTGSRAAPGVVAGRDGQATGGNRRLGLALVVIATAQLMVVLDATIVNVALPHIQTALGFSGDGLEWVVNAYALTFGGLLLLGGRAGDILGRRRVFIAGIILFSVASLLGGFATSQAWLLSARALQGVGGAIVAPTALSLVTTNFPEGAARNRAMGVYAAMSIGGAAVGLLAGGILTTFVSWRWVLFVNVPIGIVVALLAPRALAESERRPGRFDLPGAITSTLGLVALVYGLTEAATTPNGVSHWGDTKVLASLSAAVVLLAAFLVIEIAQQVRADAAAHLPQPGPLSRQLGPALRRHGHVRDVLLPDPVRAARVGVQRAADRRLLPADGRDDHGHGGPVHAAGAADRGSAAADRRVGDPRGRDVLAVADQRAQHVRGGLLGPMLVTAAGLGLIFMPATLVALSKVADRDAGLASSLPNVGQQVGGAIGLAILGTVAWTVVANTARHAATVAQSAAAAAAKAGHPLHVTAAQAKAAQVSIYDHALSVGFSRGFEVSAGIMLVALVVILIMVRVTREDLAGVQPMPS